MKRPYIICHMMSSIDGKITFGPVTGKDVGISVFGDYMNLYNQTENQLDVKALVCGRVTMSEFAEGSDTPLDDFKNIEVDISQNYIYRKDAKEYFIGVDTKGLLRWKENTITFESSGRILDLIIIVTKSTPKEYLAYLQSENISYIVAGESELDFEKALSELHSIFGIERIALEGGGGINGSMLEEGLVDEISLLMIPKVINNIEAPALFYKQLEEARLYEFKLKDVQKLERGVVWMRWSK